jgi:ABC-type multidrug transport system fused ATPase/permease subunit
MDHIIVLEKGEIIEQGSPSDLLARPAGHFKRLAGETTVN